MNFDEDDDEFVPFSIKEDVKGASLKRKKKYDPWLGEEVDDDSGDDAVLAQLGLGGGGGGGGGGGMDGSDSMFVSGGALQEQLAKEKDREKKQKTKQKSPTKAKKDKVKKDGGGPGIGQFGVGAKLLQKLGWSEEKGLGKNESGIRQALEVKMRPTGAGLGMIEEKTDAQRRLERHRRGEESSSEESDEVEEVSSLPKSALRVDRTQNWKKGTKKAKVVVKTASEVLRENLGNAPNDAQVTIVDMRGPSGAYDAERAMQDYKSGIGRELRYNMDKLVDMVEVELKKVSRKAKDLSIQSSFIEEELQNTESVLAEAESAASLLQQCEAFVSRLVSAADDMAEAAKASDEATEKLVVRLAGAFQGARTKFGEQLYVSLMLPDLLYSLLEGLLGAYFERWNCAEAPSRGAEMLSSIRDLLEGYRASSVGGQDDVDFVYWDLLVQGVMLPTLRAWLMQRWDCRKNVDVAVALVHSWSGLWGKDVEHFVLYDVILARLRQAVRQWEPSKETVPIHVWLHPWMPWLEKQMQQELFPSVITKLGEALSSDWNVRDATAFALLEPWRNSFTREQLLQLSESRIIPKLLSVLEGSSGLFSAPDSLDPDDVWSSVMMWHDWIPAGEFIKMLWKAAFVRIYKNVYSWIHLTGSVKGPQVVAFYSRLKAMFPQVLLQDKRVQALLAHVLDIGMTLLVDEFSDFVPEVLPIDLWSNVTYMEGAAKRLADSKKHPAADSAISFRSVVEDFASENNVLFVPLSNRSHNGKPLYMFGHILVYLQNHLVYAEESPGKFNVMSLEHLAQLAAPRQVSGVD